MGTGMVAGDDLQDDSTIPDNELLYRAINRSHLDGARIASAAFISRTNLGRSVEPHVSVDRSSLSSPEETLQRHRWAAGIAQLVTRTVRSFNLRVAHRPIPDNPAHTLIVRDLKLTDSAWKKIARKLATSCTWAISPSRP
jgi:hypothetical protein